MPSDVRLQPRGMQLHANAKTTPRARNLLVERVLTPKWTYREAAAAAGMSIRTAAKWVARFRRQGAGGGRLVAAAGFDTARRAALNVTPVGAGDQKTGTRAALAVVVKHVVHEAAQSRAHGAR